MSRPSSQSSPGNERRFTSPFLSEDRNNELSHKDALRAAQTEHDRVRETAIRVFQMHEIEEERKRLQEAKKVEEKRLEAEATIAKEARNLQVLQARSVPKPAPPPGPPPTGKENYRAQEARPQDESVKNAATPKNIKTPSPPAAPKPTVAATRAPRASPFHSTSTPAAASSRQLDGFQIAPSSLPKLPVFAQQVPQPQQARQIPTAQPPTTAAPKPPAQDAAPTRDRYIEIHRELKQLRQRMQSEARAAGPPLKGQVGDLRREIRVSVGQLTGGRGANAQPIQKIMVVLKDALDGKVPSSPVDVKLFVVKDRTSAPDGQNSGSQLPSLFIYLLNICAKAIINQFINEAGANVKAADPVGVFAAHIFSNKDFQWRGESLIDIMMAKFRVVCPALFGFRGNDKTERGRLAMGWKRDEGAWLSEQAHNNRMTGLGAGFAAVSLRDFSRAMKTNPLPPSNYWKAFAFIVNTPAGETSNTQYVVLRAMIEGHEQRFMNFYGNAAFAALKLALVDFPQKAPQNAPAASSLQALADVFRNDGLVF